MTLASDLMPIAHQGYALDLGLARDPRLGHDNEPVMLLRAIIHPNDPELQEDALRGYITPHEVGTVLELLQAGAPTGSVDLRFPEDAPNWWVRLTRREPGETAPELELRRLDPDSGMAESDAVPLQQTEADTLAGRLKSVFAQYTDELSEPQG